MYLLVLFDPRWAPCQIHSECHCKTGPSSLPIAYVKGETFVEDLTRSRTITPWKTNPDNYPRTTINQGQLPPGILPPGKLPPDDYPPSGQLPPDNYPRGQLQLLQIQLSLGVVVRG